MNSVYSDGCCLFKTIRVHMKKGKTLSEVGYSLYSALFQESGGLREETDTNSCSGGSYVVLRRCVDDPLCLIRGSRRH